MAATTKIITVTEVRDLALTNSNFDTALVEDYILPAQRQYIRPFLGEDFYEEITDQVENSTETSDNQTLITSYLKPTLAHFIVYDAFPEIRMNITKAGVMINSSETSVAAGAADASALRNQKLAMAERWLKDTKYFLDEAIEDDNSKYPLWCDKSRRNNKYGIIIY